MSLGSLKGVRRLKNAITRVNMRMKVVLVVYCKDEQDKLVRSPMRRLVKEE